MRLSSRLSYAHLYKFNPYPQKMNFITVSTVASSTLKRDVSNSSQQSSFHRLSEIYHKNQGKQLYPTQELHSLRHPSGQNFLQEGMIAILFHGCSGLTIQPPEPTKSPSSNQVHTLTGHTRTMKRNRNIHGRGI